VSGSPSPGRCSIQHNPTSSARETGNSRRRSRVALPPKTISHLPVPAFPIMCPATTRTLIRDINPHEHGSRTPVPGQSKAGTLPRPRPHRWEKGKPRYPGIQNRQTTQPCSRCGRTLALGASSRCRGTEAFPAMGLHRHPTTTCHARFPGDTRWRRTCCRARAFHKVLAESRQPDGWSR